MPMDFTIHVGWLVTILMSLHVFKLVGDLWPPEAQLDALPRGL